MDGLQQPRALASVNLPAGYSESVDGIRIITVVAASSRRLRPWTSPTWSRPERSCQGNPHGSVGAAYQVGNCSRPARSHGSPRLPAPWPLLREGVAVGWLSQGRQQPRNCISSRLRRLPRRLLLSSGSQSAQSHRSSFALWPST